ncbi:hypothetical protein A3D70_00540 [Candidatus Adlerbacteria bacterium RIFCSPHIGHO2_02_FULL_54_18]|uniref:Ig-like domain-containing protein n=2 Tax=Candidatus Adleribacteriota TaxID=1752736 RepID=A0A1F4Y1B0_9BACT|nr:MAG: hypothetical protein A2949_02800 [Candidatus Adlerbacteria bacterium RIFCSPLOWO2_01_FULL_54_21b]OGC87767.1 MAG: hypothetical protein A3D70_00540 [Candidatus Adlerbacteria bacterium RIFCSPHIGHO2_02_FULL_54_18]
MKKVLISIAVGLGFLVPAVVLAQSPTTGLLNVYVQVINPTGVAYSPSNFTVAVSGNSPSLTSFQGSQSGTLVSINPGSYAVTVINQYGFNPSYSVGCDNTVSAGQTQLCVITMSGGTFNPPTTLFPWTAAPPPLSCYNETPTVSLGQSARFSVQGGSGFTYNWSTATQNFPNIGPVLTTTFSVSGMQTVTVTNANQTAVCTVTVLPTYAPYAPLPAAPGTTLYQQYPQNYSAYVAPRMPNTGSEPSNGTEVAFAVVLVLGAAFMTYPYVKKALAVVVR